MVSTSPGFQQSAARSTAHELMTAALQKAHERARRHGTDAWLRVHWPLARDPFEGQAPGGFNGADPTAFLWRDPAGALDFVALGAVASVRPHGPRRLDALRMTCSWWREVLVDGASVGLGASAQDLPLAVFWSAFEGRVEGARDPWSDWPEAELRLPERLIYRRRSRGGRVTFGEVRCVAVPPVASPEIDDALMQALMPTRQPVARWAGEVDHAPLPEATGPVDPRWRDQVEAARASITAGQLSKVVLARVIDHHAPEGQRFDPQATFDALSSLHSEALCYGVSHEGAAFVGATPEVLLRVEGGQLRTHALAGTAPRGESPEENRQLGEGLLASAKDRHEQALVTRDLVEALAPFCTHLSCPPAPRLKVSGPVQHLETPITGRLARGASPLALLARLHPTPALGGTPRKAALRWLADHEGWHRGAYGGPIGWVASGGDATFAVAIRSALLAGDTAHLFVGAGLVADSSAEGEWQETALKARTMSAGLRVRHG